MTLESSPCTATLFDAADWVRPRTCPFQGVELEGSGWTRHADGERRNDRPAVLIHNELDTALI